MSIAFRCLALVALLAMPSLSNADDDFLVGTACSSAADCPLAFTCETVEMGCAEQPCACANEPGGSRENCECDDSPDDCSPGSEQRCVFAPERCMADADCSMPGFSCALQEECSGSGGCACPPCRGGDDCEPCDCEEETEEESCTVIGGYCVPAEVACTVDSDCAAGWECADFGFGGGGDSGSGRIDGEEPDVGGGSDGGSDGGRNGGPRDEAEGDVGCATCGCAPCPEGEVCEECECARCDYEDEDEFACLPLGWAAQLDDYFGSGKGGVGNDEAAGPTLGVERDAKLHQSSPTCSAAGTGALSLLPFAASLGLLLRRRRTRR